MKPCGLTGRHRFVPHHRLTPAGGLTSETPRRRHGPAPLGWKGLKRKEMEEGEARLTSRQSRLSPGGPWGWGHRRERRQNHEQLNAGV